MKVTVSYGALKSDDKYTPLVQALLTRFPQGDLEKD